MDPHQNEPQEPFEVEHATREGEGAITDNDKLLAGLSYVSQIVLPAVLPVILLVTDETKRSGFLKHHVVTSLGLLAASILYYLVATIVYLALSAITGGCLACILWVVFLVPAVALVYYGILAFQGKYVDIPYLTDFMKQNGWL